MAVVFEQAGFESGAEFVPRISSFSLVDHEVLSDEGQLFAFVPGHRILVCGGPFPRDVPERTGQRFQQSRADDGGARSLRDVVHERAPAIEIWIPSSEPRRVPANSALL